MVQRVRGRNDSDSFKCVAPDLRRPAVGIYSGPARSHGQPECSKSNRARDGLRHPMCAVLHDQQDILACTRRTIGTGSDDGCGYLWLCMLSAMFRQEEASKCPFPMPLYLH